MKYNVTHERLTVSTLGHSIGYRFIASLFGFAVKTHIS